MAHFGANSVVYLYIIYYITEMLGYLLSGPRQLLYIAGGWRDPLSGKGSVEGLWPLPKKIWDFFTWNGPFWCKFSGTLTEMLDNLQLGPQQLHCIHVLLASGGVGGVDRTSLTPSLRAWHTLLPQTGVYTDIKLRVYFSTAIAINYTESLSKSKSLTQFNS